LVKTKGKIRYWRTEGQEARKKKGNKVFRLGRRKKGGSSAVYRRVRGNHQGQNIAKIGIRQKAEWELFRRVVGGARIYASDQEKYVVKGQNAEKIRQEKKGNLIH